MERLLNFSEPLDVNLLDGVVNTLYTTTNTQEVSVRVDADAQKCFHLESHNQETSFPFPLLLSFMIPDF